MFSVSIVLKRILKRKAGNIITAAEIFIGISLVLFSINFLIDISEQNSEYLKNGMDMTYTISACDIPQDPRDYFISKEQSQRLHGVSDLTALAEISYNIITFAGRTHFENGEEITDKYIVSFTESVSGIYAEKEFAEVLPRLDEKNTVNFSDIDFELIKTPELFDDGKERVHSCKMPLDMYWQTAQPSGFAEFSLNVVCDNMDGCENISALSDILSEQGEYEFRVGNEFYDFLSKASYARYALSKVVFFSAVMLAVVFVGIVCVFLRLVDERAFETAVCRAAGASALTVFCEFFAELLVISFVPAFASVALNCLLFNNGARFVGATVSCMHASAVVFVLAGILTADIICIIPVIVRLRRLKPYELLIAEG